MVIWNQIISLNDVNSTNNYLKEKLNIDKNIQEGLIITARNQSSGRGQINNIWESEKDKNLTFSVFLKPNLKVENQFILSKVIALGVYDFCIKIGLNDSKIKWPNDILINGKKIAGILIENTIRGNCILNSIVGIGFNVNQEKFEVTKATSYKIEMKKELELKNILLVCLECIEKRYIQLITHHEKDINTDYLNNLFGYQIEKKYNINDKKIIGKIVGVENNGKLKININKELHQFNFKEIEFIL